MCLLNVAIPAIVWVYCILGEYKAADITIDFEQFSLVLSCIVLVWSMCRLVRIVQSVSDKLVNKLMIILHITAYLFIIIVNVALIKFDNRFLRAYEIFTVCYLVIYFVCSLIFGLIVN